MNNSKQTDDDELMIIITPHVLANFNPEHAGKSGSARSRNSLRLSAFGFCPRHSPISLSCLVPEGEQPKSFLLSLFRRKFDEVLINVRHARVEASNLASVDVKSGRAGHIDRLAQREGRIDARLGLRLGGAGCDFRAFDTSAVGDGRDFICIFGGNIRTESRKFSR